MRGIAILLLTLACLGAAAAGDTSGQGDQRLTTWLDSRYEEELAFSPMELARLGRKQAYDRIDDYSEQALAAQLAWQQASVARLKQEFDYTRLSPQARLSYDYWVYRAQRATQDAKYRAHWYLFDQVGGGHTELPEFMINYHQVASIQDMRDYNTRLQGIARALGQLLERAQEAAADGIRPPRFAYDIVIEEAGKVITGAPFGNGPIDAPLWADARAKLTALGAAGGVEEPVAASLLASTRNTLVTEVQPAYQALITWLQRDRQHSLADPAGAASLPDGVAFYGHALQYFTTTDLSASEVHALGLAEVSRLRAAMEAIKDQLKFDGTLAEFFDFVRSDARFYYANDDAGRQAYIEETRHYLELIERKLPEYFGVLPRANLEIRRVEAFREQDGASASYADGTADGTRPGVYYMHLSDMSANNRTDLQTTAYHEGNPGHHMQSSIALERTDLPLFRTNVWYSAYGEGWALYAEQLAWEMGVYDDPYYNFGRLGAEIFRAIRLVVDTGLHARGWTEQQAIDYMLANSAIPETAVRSEIRRYLVWPGQATSYKIGMLKLLELRQRAQDSLGDDFDIRGFHDVVLTGGSLPLAILERRVDDWIAEQAR